MAVHKFNAKGEELIKRNLLNDIKKNTYSLSTTSTGKNTGQLVP